MIHWLPIGSAGRSNVVYGSCSLVNSLRQDRPQVRLVEDADQVRYLALKRDSQTKDCEEVRELDSQLHRTHVRLGDADEFGQRLLAEPAFQTDLTNTRAEQLPGCGCISGMSHRILTNQ